MSDDLLVLGALFVIAYVLGRLGKRIGLPAVPIYMIVGVLASPHTEIFPLSFPAADVELVAVFGLILLLFNLGLEFDQDAFISGAGRMLLSGGAYIVLNVGLGLLFGFLVGWGPREALIIAGMVGTSSSAIITKLLIELRRLANAETPVILGATVVGDVFIAVYLAVVAVVLSGRSNVWGIVLQLGIAIGFLAAMTLLARFAARPVNWLFTTHDDELVTVLFFGLAVLFAGLGEVTSVTDAIGAFLIGLVLGATRNAARIQRLSEPLRDVFGAFFFLNFGLALDIGKFGSVVGEVAIAVVGTLLLNVVSGLVIARLNGLHRREGINIAAILTSRGEFTLILATLAVGAGLDPRLTPFAGLYVLVMAIAGPLFAANSERIGHLAGPRTSTAQRTAEELRATRATIALDPIIEQAMRGEAEEERE
ncbi:cation:proton antiporter [Gryllotalpicola sp.]|uniref:cation:proton antiporter n=1 Tax=Gryllotalpicola sp. TaxID=1932787 RepID=UPI00261C3F12|nr:cation:proton antiporter [Gryllotalpicola sp.]